VGNHHAGRRESAECGGDEGAMGPSRKFCGGRVAVHDAVWQGSGSARAAAEATTNQLTHVGTCCGLGRSFFSSTGSRTGV
jgi:hypothetical protein